MTPYQQFQARHGGGPAFTEPTETPTAPIGTGIPTEGDKVVLHIATGADVDRTDEPGGTLEFIEEPAGTVYEVTDVGQFRGEQGLYFILTSGRGVCVTIDRTDCPDGRTYPFTLHQEEAR